MTRIALVAGPTGLIGRSLLQRLLNDPAYTEVRALSRRALRLQHPRLRVHLADYADLTALGDALAVDDVFCCLGTTLTDAGSRAAFEDVDYRMVVDLARAARRAGAQQFLVVSAVGASRHALAFYSRVKGRMESAVSALDYPAVHILRPSLLLGERTQPRPAEAAAQKLMPRISPLLRGPLARYRAVAGSDVAEAMQRLALRGSPGVHVHHLPLED
jgi:uncharacterized protein YbjT (DUF2867 family)